MGLADVGCLVCQLRARPEGPGEGDFAPPPGAGAGVGFVPPDRITQEVRAIDFSAGSLRSDIDRNIDTHPIRATYEQWFSTVWSPFRDELLSWRRRFTPVGLADTDAQWDQVMRRRKELEDFARAYSAITKPGPGGANVPVPPPTAPVPTDPGPPPNFWQGFPGVSKPGMPSLSIPWWGWLLAGLGVAGAGYLGYRWYRVTTEQAASYRTALFESEAGKSILGGLVARDAPAAVAAPPPPPPPCGTCGHGGV